MKANTYRFVLNITSSCIVSKLYIREQGCGTCFALSLNDIAYIKILGYFHRFFSLVHACLACWYANPSCIIVFIVAISSGRVAVFLDQTLGFPPINSLFFFCQRVRFSSDINSINNYPYLYALFICCQFSMPWIHIVKNCNNHGFYFTPLRS